MLSSCYERLVDLKVLKARVVPPSKANNLQDLRRLRRCRVSDGTVLKTVECQVFC